MGCFTHLSRIVCRHRSAARPPPLAGTGNLDIAPSRTRFPCRAPPNAVSSPSLLRALEGPVMTSSPPKNVS